MLRHGGSQPRKEEGASHHARRGKNAEAFLKSRYGREHDLALQIDVFTDGDEVLDGFRAGYDILFLDIEMPFLTGMDAAEQIRETDKDVTIIFVTNNPHYAILGYKVAALDYILKPVSYETVAEVMSRALKHRGTRTKKYVSEFINTRIRNKK